MSNGAFGYVEPSSAAAFAEDIMAIVLGFAETAVAESLSIAGNLDDLATVPEVTIPAQTSEPISFSRALDALNYLLAIMPDNPSFYPISTTLADVPALGDIPEVGDVDIDDFTTAAPAVNIGVAPELDDYTAPAKPIVELGAVPERPEIVYPDVPVLGTVTLPSPVEIDLPTFDETFNLSDLTAPANTFSFNEETYSSTLKTAIETGLLDLVQNGEYFIDSTDETPLWNRMRERELAGANLAEDEARTLFTRGGFPMPTGAMLKATQRARQEVIDKISTANREVALRRSEMYVEGKKWSYNEARELETVLINLHNATQERALNAAKAEVQVAIDIFNAQVSLYSLHLDRYKTLAAVYETRVRAEIAKVEIYKAQIEGARLTVDVQRLQVDLYSARLDAVKRLIEAYQADIQIMNSLADLERLKMEIFRAEIEAFVAQIQAKEMEFRAYESQIRGEIAKVEAFRAEAQAYEAKMEGKKAFVDVNRLRIEGAVARNRGLIDEYSMNADSHNNRRDAEKMLNDAYIEQYRSQVAAFSAEADAISKAYGLDQQAREDEYRQLIAALNANTETAKVQLQRVVSIAQLQMEAMRSQADTYRSLAASSLAAMNCNASLSDHYGASESLGENWSHNSSIISSKNVSEQQSDSYMFSENHNFNYDID